MSRLDFIQVGYFFCKSYSEFINKKSLQKILNFQKKFPNAVIITIDYALIKCNNYGINCFRVNKSLMDTMDELDINNENNDIGKRFVSEKNLLKNLAFSLSDDVYTVFSTLSQSNDDQDKESTNLDSLSYKLKTNICVRLNELNKLSGNFIEEQKKYINYYKVKKQYGKTKESEFFELLNKKGNELASLDKLDISICSKNILSMNERLKTITDRINIKNSFAINI
jgi:hypothetical protein